MRAYVVLERIIDKQQVVLHTSCQNLQNVSSAGVRRRWWAKGGDGGEWTAKRTRNK